MAMHELEQRCSNSEKKEIALRSNGTIKGSRATPTKNDRVIDKLIENGWECPSNVPGEATVGSTIPTTRDKLLEEGNKFWLTKAGEKALEMGKHIIPKVDNKGVKVLVGGAAVLGGAIAAYELYKRHSGKKK